MPCQTIRLEGGGVAIVCSRGRRERQKICAYCMRARATLLCDGPPRKPGGKTCDSQICESCATTIAPDTHLCRYCAGVATRARAWLDELVDHEMECGAVDEVALRIMFPSWPSLGLDAMHPPRSNFHIVSKCSMRTEDRVYYGTTSSDTWWGGDDLPPPLMRYAECPECGESLVYGVRGHICYGGHGDPSEGPSEQEILGTVGSR